MRFADISASGAMLTTDAPALIGALGQLRAGIGSAFVTGVEVRRVAAGGERSSPGVGVKFTGMDDRSRRSLEDFLKKATHE